MLILSLNRSCDPCDCDPAGSTNNTCEVITGQCECKQFVMGRQCNVCEEGSSNLEADNPYGCSKGIIYNSKEGRG